MQIPIYHVDAFTKTIFSGNPAAVCILKEWLPEPQLQSIATENLLPVTAFLKPEPNGYSTRWFTPEGELLLCGHGSLASAFIIFHYLQPDKHEIELHNHHAGTITVSRHHNDSLQLKFPSKPPVPLPIPELLSEALATPVQEFQAYQQERCLILLENEATVRNLKPHMPNLLSFGYPGIILTAPGEQTDFVSRTFYPRKTLFPEDPVTGASHCLLTPYWAKKLGKTTLTAQQVSARGGYIHCELQENHVILNSHATLYSQGTISI